MEFSFRMSLVRVLHPQVALPLHAQLVTHFRNVILPKARLLFDKLRGQRVEELYTENECMKMILARRNFSDWVCLAILPFHFPLLTPSSWYHQNFRGPCLVMLLLQVFKLSQVVVLEQEINKVR